MNMRKRIYIFSLLLAWATFSWTGCNDDDIYNSNEMGSTLEEVGDYKLSTFFLEKGIWEIPDSVTQIRVQLQSHTDDTLFEFDASVQHDSPSYSLFIPKGELLPDSDYDLTAYFLNGKQLGTKLKVTVRDEMLYAIIASSVVFTLEGDGTEENPYQIGSQDDFSMFEYGLYRDSISHGAGLYFIQTADFTAPPRSEVYEGRLYAGEVFAGNYDGQGHTVKISFIGSGNTEKDVEIGLFKQLTNGATIQNLSLDVDLQNVANYGGALAGKTSGTVSISNIEVSGTIKATGSYIGGFIGHAEGTLIANSCCFHANVSGSDYVGGLLGRLETNGELKVNGFTNFETGNTNPSLFTVSGENKVGGMVGSISEAKCDIQNVTLQHQISEEEKDLNIIHSNVTCGGLAGEAAFKSSTVSNISIMAPVKGEGSSIGGLFGYCKGMEGMSTFSSIKVTSYVSGAQRVGGFIGRFDPNGLIKFTGMPRANRIAQVDNGYLEVEGSERVGGLFGEVTGDFLTDAVFLVNVNVNCSSNYAGGVVGLLVKGTVDCTDFYLDPNMRVTGPDAVGGIVGYASEATVRGPITEDIDFSSIPEPDDDLTCYGGIISSGGTSGNTGTSMGGIVGYAENSTLEGLYMTGQVFGNARVGGIVGHMRLSEKGGIKNCMNNSTAIIGAGEETGGIAGRIELCEGTFGRLINYAVVSGENNTGGIFGRVEYTTSSAVTLEYLVNTDSITGGQSTAGGCIGLIYDSERRGDHRVRYSANYGPVTAGSGEVGGIVGNGKSSRMIIERSANHGRIAGGANVSRVGGIAGSMGQDPGGITLGENMELAYCCNRGTISSGNFESFAGGLLGYQEEGNQSDSTHWMTHDCYNMGSVTTDQHEDNGGIIGCVDHYAEVRYCINVGKVADGNGVVGTHKDACIWYAHDLYYLKDSGKGWKAKEFLSSEAKNSSTFNNFDFTNIWVIDSDGSKNEGYPYLKDCPFQFIYWDK